MNEVQENREFLARIGVLSFVVAAGLLGAAAILGLAVRVFTLIAG